MTTPNIKATTPVTTSTQSAPAVIPKAEAAVVAKPKAKVQKYSSGRPNTVMLTELGTRIFFKNNVFFTSNKEIIDYLDTQCELGVAGITKEGEFDAEVLNAEEAYKQKIIAEYEAKRQLQALVELESPTTSVTGMLFSDHVAN